MLRGTATIALKPLANSRCGSPGNHGISCGDTNLVPGDAPESPPVTAPISPPWSTFQRVPVAVGQHGNAFPEDGFRLSPKVPSASQPLRPIAGSADNVGIEMKIRCLKKRKASALGRRLVMPVDDLGTPSPHEGSICCEKETDRFSICYGDDVSVRRE